MPSPSHPIGIRVYNIQNVLLEGATVVLTLNSECITGTTDSNGEVILNTADLTSGWNVGDVVSITANKATMGTITELLTLTAAPQSLNLTLSETSSLIYAVTENQHVLNFALITTFDGEKVTHSNPLPVVSVDSSGNSANSGFTEVFAYNSDNLVEYTGKSLPNSSKGSAVWQIKKLTYSGTNVTDIQFAGGTDEFDKVWDSRTTYNYS